MLRNANLVQEDHTRRHERISDLLPAVQEEPEGDEANTALQHARRRGVETWCYKGEEDSEKDAHEHSRASSREDVEVYA